MLLLLAMSLIFEYVSYIHVYTCTLSKFPRLYTVVVNAGYMNGTKH